MPVKTLYFFLTIVLLLASCQKNSKAGLSFYYWRTTFDLSVAERKAIKENGVSRLYIRYFDVDFHQTKGVFPRAPIRFLTNPEVKVVPVLYIKNDVFKNEIDVDDLAKKCLRLIDDINRSAAISSDEIQLDCDWTEKTRHAYFAFVEKFKTLSGKRISATIRLHQMKYPGKAGIPNVDKGVLMYYNMSAIGTNVNSIYDRKTALRYIKSLPEYPLKLDVALPVYTWGVLIRDGRPIRLKRKEDLVGIEDNPDFEKSEKQFTARKSHYFHGTHYQKGDRIKMESVSPDQLTEMAEDLSESMKKQPQEVIFYDLDEFNLNRYETDIFSETTGIF